MTVYIIDIIGKHSGAHFYNKSFRDTLTGRYSQTKLISNYSDQPDDPAPLLRNFYEGNIIEKAGKLCISIISYCFFVISHRKNYYIFLSYGNPSEILFAWPLIICRKKIIDAHEVFSLISKNKVQEQIRVFFAKFLYNHLADAVIIHSDRSAWLLQKLKFRKKILFIPHFPYVTDREYSISEIPDEIRSLIAVDRINILFFGYVRLSKGIEDVILLAKKISSMEIGKEVNFIVAGNDPKNIVKSLLKEHRVYNLQSFSSLLRYITDDELKYLFTETDFILLPYRQISQSGVLEMAVLFKKPVITSPLEYFKNFLGQFPSFGIYCSDSSPDIMSQMVSGLAMGYKKNSKTFYTEDDLKRYADNKDPVHFLKELESVFPLTN